MIRFFFHGPKVQLLLWRQICLVHCCQILNIHKRIEYHVLGLNYATEIQKWQHLHCLATTLHDNHSTTDIKLGCFNLSITYPQAICRNTPITQSFKVSNWGPSVWICYCQLWFKNEDNMLSCNLLLTLQGICGVNRMDAQPLVQRPLTEPACRRVIILILLHWLITMLAVNFAFNHRP